MKSLITLKILLGLLSTAAIPVVVLTGITQSHFSVEMQKKGSAEGFGFEQSKVLESKGGSQRWEYVILLGRIIH
jgi:hypothetical protein